MDFLYIDETGKNIFSDTSSKGLYIYGGIILNKDSVYECLNKFKLIYQNHRSQLIVALRKSIDDTPTKSKTIIMSELLRHYEVHSYYMFNKSNPEKNPWIYYANQNKYQMAFEIVEAMIEHIEAILYFKADRSTLNIYYDSIGLFDSDNRQKATIRDRFTEDKMIECIITEFNHWLIKVDRKGAIIPDEFESGMRELFLSKMNKLKFERCWNEPVLVSSKVNAFTQTADLFTYIFMKTISSKPNKNKAFKNMYHRYIEPKAIVFDLEAYLVASNMNSILMDSNLDI